VREEKTRGEVRIPSVMSGVRWLEPNKTKEKMRWPLPKVYIPQLRSVLSAGIASAINQYDEILN
jgi:hypothetical protein